jgi:hypothetical protein
VCCWTGLRRGDVQRLTWDAIGSDRITVTARKTGSTHEIPLSRTIERHLESIRGGPDRIFDLPKSNSFKRWRAEMHQIAEIPGIPPITWKQMRQFAITTWTTANPEAGRIVHGCGMGVLDHYVDRFRVLEDAEPLVQLPAAFLSPQERSAWFRAREELIRLLSRANPTDRKLLLQIARKIAQ